MQLVMQIHTPPVNSLDNCKTTRILSESWRKDNSQEGERERERSVFQAHFSLTSISASTYPERHRDNKSTWASGIDFITLRDRSSILSGPFEDMGYPACG